MKKIKVILLIVLICFIYTAIFIQIINAKSIIWGMEMAGLSLGGKDISQSKQFIQGKWNEFVNHELKLTYKDQTWIVTLNNLGFQLDIDKTIDKIYSIGHYSNIFKTSKEQYLSLFGKYNLSPVYTINQEEFNNKTRELFENIEKPAQNATLFFNKEVNDFSLHHSVDGIAIDRDQLINNINNQINSFSNKSITLKLIIDEPEIKNEEVETAKKEAQRIMANQPYYLTHEIKNLTIDRDRLIDWISFEPIKEENSDNLVLGFSLDYEKVKKYLNTVAYQVDQPVTNAQIEIENNRATVFVSDSPGFEVKKDITFDNLVANLLAVPSVKTTPIVSDKALPKIRLWQTNDLGIKKLVGQGHSNFAGSPTNRKHNIQTSVNKLNGYIMAPGEEFSFVNTLGATGPEEGYLAELVIKNKKTTLEYGGGVCQVSTTFFRAAVNSGLKITERQNHSFPVAYYNPQGFDATIYDPKPDLMFVNNTPNHLLIQAYISGNQVFVNFYATDDKRTVNIKGPYVLESNEDGSMKAVLTQEVFKLSGDTLEKQVFYSNYKSPDLYPIDNGGEEEESIDSE